MRHPAFDFIPNDEIAEMCSSTLIDRGKYTYVATEMDIDRYSEVEGFERAFPPVSADMIMVHTAHLARREDGLAIERSMSTHGNKELLPNLDEAADLYERTIVPHQQTALSLLQPTLTGLSPKLAASGGVAGWAVDEALTNKKPLLAAHITARVAHDNELLDSLVFPVEFENKFPMILRDTLSRLLPMLSQLVDAEALPGDFMKVIEPIMVNSEQSRTLGAAVASVFLLTPDEYREALDGAL